ncbi:MAG: hypothetical protein MZU97_26590 [Bacillus subtilis]|nr:hypothetical protein [Bacillus subtilis]
MSFGFPCLFLLQRFGVGYISLGYIMFFSNLLTTLVAFGMLFFFYKKVKAYGYMGMKLNENEAIL